MSTIKSGSARKTHLADGSASEALLKSTLAESEASVLLECDDLQHLSSILTEKLNLTEVSVELKENALLDLYALSIWWARQQAFNQTQIRLLFHVIDSMITFMKEESSTWGAAVLKIKSLISPSELHEFYDPKLVESILLYVHSTLLAHFKLYKFLLLSRRDLFVITHDDGVEVPPPVESLLPAPLDEALAANIYQTYASEFGDEAIAEFLQPLQDEVVEAVVKVEVQAQELANEEGPAEEGALWKQLSPQEISDVVASVCKKMTAQFMSEMSTKLRGREDQLMNKIGKIKLQ